MDKRTKAHREYLRALAVVESVYGEDLEGQDTLKAILLGVSSLLNPPKKQATKREYNPVAVNFLNTLLREAGDSVIQDPFDSNWYQLMSWKLRDIPELTLDDAVAVGEYLAEGGWRGGNRPTVKQVISYIAELLANANKQDAYDPRYSV